MDFILIVSFLCLLLAKITIVSCDIKLTCKVDRFILEENTPFVMSCNASYKDNKVITGSFIWTYDVPPNKNRVSVTDDSINNTILTTSNDKMITSTVNVIKPPLISKLFYYYAKFENPQDSDEQSMPVRLFRETTIPTPEISNSVNDTGSETIAAFGDKVILMCKVGYDNTNHNTKDQYAFTLSWRKGNKPSDIVKRTSPSPYNVGKNTEELSLSVTVTRSSNGGDYSCWMDLYTLGPSKVQHIIRNTNITLKIRPQVNGAVQKEVKKAAGSDVDLHCDIIGYPIEYEWLDENREKIDSKNDSRITINTNVLSIDDIDYGDRKTYICVGKLGDDQLEQVIILRVKDPLAPLWPFIGIVLEVILIALIIGSTHYYKSKHPPTTDGDTEPVIMVDPTASSTNV